MDTLAEVHEIDRSLETSSNIKLPEISEKTVKTFIDTYTNAENDFDYTVADKKSPFHWVRQVLSPKARREEKNQEAQQNNQLFEYAKEYFTRLKIMQDTMFKFPEDYPMLYRRFKQILDAMTFSEITPENAIGSVEEAKELTKSNILNGFGTVLLAYETQVPGILKKLNEVQLKEEPDILFENALHADRQYPATLSTPDKVLNTLVNRFNGLPEEINGAQAAYDYLQYRADRVNNVKEDVPIAA